MGTKVVVLLVTVNDKENAAVREVFAAATGAATKPHPKGDKIYHELGELNGIELFQLLSQMGSGGIGGAQQAVDRAIAMLSPCAVIGVGIAFGMHPKRQQIGDVLISNQVALYDPERVSTDKKTRPVHIHRGDIAHASGRLIDYFNSAASYELEFKTHFGLLLSGAKLIDNLKCRLSLQEGYPEAIGGDMEAEGIYVACKTHNVDWIIVKGISDWADGRKYSNEDARQKRAATNAAHFLLHAFRHAPLAASPRVSPFEGQVASVSPFEKNISRFRTLVKAERYDEAFAHFRHTLNYEMDFIRSDNHTYRDLIFELFQNQPDTDPPLNTPEARATALSFLGRAYKNIGAPIKAVEVYKRQLQIEPSNGSQRLMGLANIANALRLTGRLREAAGYAREMLNEAKTMEPVWQAYGLYWNGVLRAGIGEFGDGIRLLREAQVLFEDVEQGSLQGECAAGIGRAYAHLAQIELWLGNARGALTFARHAQRLVERHRQHRERIFSTRLVGVASLALDDLATSGDALKQALGLARQCYYFEEELAAAIGLADLSRRQGNLPLARQLLIGELRTRPEMKEYSLLMSDFYNTLCEVYREEPGRKLDAIEAAKNAYASAWCDGPPYSYYWGIEQARRHLAALGARPPLGGFLDQPLESITAIGILNQQELTRAQIRAEFTMFLRSVNSSYRYAPTKFVKLLSENWPAIRNVVTDKHCVMSPQFIEIHVSEPCNLNCVYCRGKLRQVPLRPRFVPTEVILQLIGQISELNPHAFVRISGLIGEPLKHPHIADIFEALNRADLNWAVTTNGVEMTGKKLRSLLLKATYVHFSVDAGTEPTYRNLKRGKRGDFEKVLQNISSLADEKRRLRPTLQIVVSFLLQEENYRELPDFALRVKTLGADSLEIKMQHYDERRAMTERAIDEAYELISRIRRDICDVHFRVVVVQDQDQALRKVTISQDISFKRCYANLLGLSPTIDPEAKVQMCCQYYQPTLGDTGDLKKESLTRIWSGDLRRTKLMLNPKEHCRNCSPSDDFVNRFVQFLKDSYEKDDSFLDWVEKEAQIGEGRLPLYTRHATQSG